MFLLDAFKDIKDEGFGDSIICINSDHALVQLLLLPFPSMLHVDYYTAYKIAYKIDLTPKAIPLM